MASNIFARECPQCGRSAIEDNYYKSGETYIVCYRCGYSYSKKIVKRTKSSVEYKEVEFEGYGVISIVKKDGDRTVMMIDSILTLEEIDNYRDDLSKDDIDQKKSFMVTYNEGVFTIKYGTPSKNFHLPFEQYKAKMIKKYGEDEYSDILVPIEE